MIDGANQAYVDESWTEFELNIRGDSIVIRLELGAGRSTKFSDNPYIIVWNLISFKPVDLYKISREEVIQLLKDALNVYGYAGARRQIEHTIVKFNF